jgi:molybdenum cofactor biosynthesis enzyme MoaA
MTPTEEKIDGISILVGTSACNANCKWCAGKQHRKHAPQYDGMLDESKLRDVLDYCYGLGCSYITLTGSGEPTLSPTTVTKALGIIHEYRHNGIVFDPVNLYTNGIRIGYDEQFCKTYLQKWKQLGLTSIYVSVYSSDEKLNAEAFGVAEYPEFETIFRRVKKHNLILRVSVILKKGNTDTREKFQKLCEMFFALGVDNISAWPLKNNDDSISDQAPEEECLRAIQEYAECSSPMYVGSSERTIRVLLGDNKNKQTIGKKVALFQNGEISDVWCARK